MHEFVAWVSEIAYYCLVWLYHGILDIIWLYYIEAHGVAVILKFEPDCQSQMQCHSIRCVFR